MVEALEAQEESFQKRPTSHREVTAIVAGKLPSFTVERENEEEGGGGQLAGKDEVMAAI